MERSWAGGESPVSSGATGALEPESEAISELAIAFAPDGATGGLFEIDVAGTAEAAPDEGEDPAIEAGPGRAVSAPGRALFFLVGL